MPMSYHDNEARNAAIGFILVIILILGAFIYFFIANPETVAFDEYGIEEKFISGELTGEIYESGFHYVGWNRDLIKVKSTFKTVEFKETSSLKTRTQDGLALSLELSLQYRLIKDRVITLYKEFKDDIDNQVVRVARDVLRDIASLYAGVDYFSDRTAIGNAMEVAIYDVLYELGVELGDYQLRQVDLPDDFEQRITDLEKARQDVLIATEQQKREIIEAETLLEIATINAERKVIDAQGEAEAFIISVEAMANATYIELNATGQALYDFAKVMGFNATQLLAYLWIQALLKIGEFGNMVIITENTPILNTIQTNSTS